VCAPELARNVSGFDTPALRGSDVEQVIAPARPRPLIGLGRLSAVDREKTGAKNNSNYSGTGKPFSSVQATESHKNSLLKTNEISPAPVFSRPPSTTFDGKASLSRNCFAIISLPNELTRLNTPHESPKT